jgi:hypothetical protein
MQVRVAMLKKCERAVLKTAITHCTHPIVKKTMSMSLLKPSTMDLFTIY